MTSLLNFAAPVGRTLLVSVFLISGFTKIGGFEATQGYMEAMGVPGALLIPTIAFEFLAPLAVIAGLYARSAAFLLAGFSVLTALIFHFNLDDQMQSILFMKNISLAGGLLLLVAYGPGAFSVQAKQ